MTLTYDPRQDRKIIVISEHEHLIELFLDLIQLSERSRYVCVTPETIPKLAGVLASDVIILGVWRSPRFGDLIALAKSRVR